MKVMNLINFEKEAQRIINEAKETAGKIIQEAKKDADAIKKGILDDSQHNIEEQVKSKLSEREKFLKEEIHKVLSEENSRAVAHFLTELRHNMDNRLNELGANLLSLSTMIARKVIHKEIQLSPEIITKILHDAMGYIVTSKKYRIITNPSTLEYVKGFIEKLRSDPTFRNSSFEMDIDESMHLGGCRIETSEVVVDASIEGQLKRIEEYLR